MFKIFKYKAPFPTSLARNRQPASRFQTPEQATKTIFKLNDYLCTRNTQHSISKERDKRANQVNRRMKNWSREETIIAFNAYCKIAFKNSSKQHPLIIHYAQILGRTPSALNMKIGNIGRLDPELKTQGIKGLTHGAKMEQEIWDEFYANPERLVFESERLIAKFSKKNIEEITDIDITNLPEGKERETIIRQRVNQSFFRSVVMSSYNYRCCISGVGNPQLLEACHIVDWTTEVANRTNPKNGLCLNSFFHKAYDQYLLAITPDFKILLAEELIRKTANSLFKTYLERINGNSITLPDKFKPRKDLLELHYKAFLSRKIAE